MPCKTPPPRKLTRFKTASWDMAAADDLEGSAPITPWAERTVSGTILIDPADQEPQPEPTPVEQLAAVPEPASEPVPAGNAPPAIPLVSLFAVEGELTLTEALGQYLTKGEIDWSGWDEDTLTQLGSEVTKGEAVLGIDDTGSVKRVVSVAKPVLYDGESLLVEAFQSFPGGKCKVKCTGMSEKFNPLEESCQAACVRAVSEELKSAVTHTDFLPDPLLAKVAAPSRKYGGLPSEYHLYYCMLAQDACEALQANQVPRGQMTSVDELDSSTNPKTLWWVWSTDGSTGAMEDELCLMASTTPFQDSVDFRSKLKLGTPGEQIKEEMDIAKAISERA